MSKMTRFHTRSDSENGYIVKLLDPITGEDTGEWIKIRGMDSDQFKIADARGRRELLQMVQNKPQYDQEEYDRLVIKIERKCVAALIMEWSFEEEVSSENTYEFLKAAPQICDTLNYEAAKRSNFSTRTSENSTDGQNQK